MLASLADLGYAVEWRVINAADTACPALPKGVLPGISQEYPARGACGDKTTRTGCRGRGFCRGLRKQRMVKPSAPIEGSQWK